jgi:Spy/CpxP family protein refolding chaperone
MEIYSKAALAVLALAFSCSPVLAQGNPQDPPPEQQGARGGFGPRGPMRPMRPGEERGRWGHVHDGFGQGNRMGRRGFGMGPREFGLARLLNDPAIRQQVGITAEQAATIRQQESDFRKTEIRGRADLEVKRIDLKDLLAADKPDRAAIDSKLQEIGTAQLALEKSAIDYRLTVRDTISPGQREKLRQLMSDRRRRDGGPAHPSPQGAGQRRQRGTAPAPNSQGHPQDGTPPNN